MKNFSLDFLEKMKSVLENINSEDVDNVILQLKKIRDSQGRLFILGNGGSAGSAGHAVNDFRKLCLIEAYAPTDNVSELTARINDEGYASCFSEWLRVSRLSSRDGILILSVGGGDLEKNISPNLVQAIVYSKSVGAKVLGIVGNTGGFTKKMADACVLIPNLHPDFCTPITESFCVIVWHLIVSHPLLKMVQTKWESVKSDKKMEIQA